MKHLSRLPQFSPATRLSGGSTAGFATVQLKRPPPQYVRRDFPRETAKDAASRTELKQKEVLKPKRNHVGVQLLARDLHAQIFRNVSFPPPTAPYVRIAREHLEMHGLDPKQGSVLPDTSFTLPPLQGDTLDEHFHVIGARSAEPWLSLANDLAAASLPPKPDYFDLQPGWTKYHHRADGSSYSESVPYPIHDGAPEKLVVFDVETMPAFSPYPVMACAATPHGWYAWISPWLLGLSTDPAHLVPMGPPEWARVVVGHNVSYDRARIAEEYALTGTGTRFLDTMALHVAVKGISSHQRPAWNKHKKAKAKGRERRMEAVGAIEAMLAEACAAEAEAEGEERAQLQRIIAEFEESLPALRAAVEGEGQVQPGEVEDAESEARRWEDLTSANSLADVAHLHCGIELDKEIRSDFMTRNREEILEGVQDYLQYCAGDVEVTHAVFTKTLPAFLAACPHPVSFAGVLAMGSSFLTVNQEWERYLQSAEGKYKELDEGVKQHLVDLAEEARRNGEWKESPWLSQLDWEPKKVGASRGVFSVEASETAGLPRWHAETIAQGPFAKPILNRTLPLLLRLQLDGQPVQYSTALGWHAVDPDGEEILLSTKKTMNLLGPTNGRALLKDGRLSSADAESQVIMTAILEGDRSDELGKRILKLATRVAADGASDEWTAQLDWKASTSTCGSVKPAALFWPKWYWDLTKPRKGFAPGSIDLTVSKRISPLLLQLSWQGWPLFHSREHGWTFRVPRRAEHSSRTKAVSFIDEADAALAEMDSAFMFFKLPHKDGEAANVGSPLGKTFMKYAQDGTLTSPSSAAQGALDMNAQCSYWISARDRITNQVVLWQDREKGRDLGFEGQGEKEKWGVILPQVVTMGTVTRRAMEKTWLTASNAKKNRVGSELKAMVRAPEGYAIVGADVDSEELWIASVMGDAQFGLHGATALGWMTLEGTKAAGTDLHSKTASILGISRDQAKVFNYSRIYGAGMRHAVLLLLQANAGMPQEEAQRLAENLYASTKGKNTHRKDLFGRKFWHGGTESFVFNKLEEIALSDRPQTPALGCGVTDALAKQYLTEGFGTDYMTSRINWVVQSSGVDYLHMLIVAMDHLVRKYRIDARYLLSVHDELRYLVRQEDRYRAALALQIANLWTRSMFAYRLGMDDLPQGVAFFSAVDVDHVLRKEVDMPCVTPSQPDPIAPGESLNIVQTLKKTNGGSLFPDGKPMPARDPLRVREATQDILEATGYAAPDCLRHRAQNAHFLQAQATKESAQIRMLARKAGQFGDPKKAKGGAEGRTEKGEGKSRGRSSSSVKTRKVLSVVNVLEAPELVDLAERYLQWQEKHRM